MQYTTLGRTGLRVSRMGLGCGGHSRLGLALGKSEDEAAAVVRAALELGVNFIDTAESYGTEASVGRALREAAIPRAAVVISTKAGIREEGELCTPAAYRRRVERCLARLGLEYVDVFHLHGVSAEDYDYAVNEIVPEMEAMRQEGLIRFIGITEAFGPDPSHKMMSKACKDTCWDVVMIGWNLLNFSADDVILPAFREHGAGTLLMFAVRRALSRPDVLRELMVDLAAKGDLGGPIEDLNHPLGFLLSQGGADSIPDAAYRFCRYESGMDVILSGTSNIAHLKENAATLERPPISPESVARLRALFGGLDTLSGN